MLTASTALQEHWKNDCKKSCSMYWISMKAMPFTRYESCVRECVKKRQTEEIIRIRSILDVEMSIKDPVN